VELTGRVVVVTGVSRPVGIGFAIAKRLLDQGASVFAQSWTPYDQTQPHGSDPGGMQAALEALGGPRDSLAHTELDLGLASSPHELISEARHRFGHIDAVVVNHARGSEQSLEEVTAEELDATWAVNARASVLLTQAFAAQHDDSRPGGRVVLFTSGQHLGPMSREIPYAISKGAIHQMTWSLADALADRGITVNAVNPGPTDTGWATEALTEQVARAFPSGRWGTPAQVAAVVVWLVSDDAATITGQVINAEAGFRRSTI
jgi:3-oxoacyl-[acyl-carrier protein] reductase